jgi:hypothetical protein
MAELVRKYAEPFLLRDREACASLNRLIEEANAHFQAKMDKLREMRRVAEPAWKARDYAHIVALYEPLFDDIADEEKKRLAEARRELAARVPTCSRSGE